MTTPSPALSFVIPLYHSAETIRPLVKEIEALTIEGGHEIVLVNDGSSDRTEEVCCALIAETGCGLWSLRDEAAFALAEFWELVYQSDDRLGIG